MERPFHNLSIRSRLLLISAGLVFLIVVPLIALITTYASDSLRSQMQHNLDITLLGESRSLHERIEKLKEDTDSWSQEPIVTLFFERPNLEGVYRPGLDSLFRHRLKNTPWISNILLVDGDEITYQYTNSHEHDEFTAQSDETFISALYAAPEVFSINLSELETESAHPSLLLKTEYTAQTHQDNPHLLVTVVDLTEFHHTFYSRNSYSENDFFTFVSIDEGGRVQLPVTNPSEPMGTQFNDLIRTWSVPSSEYLVSDSIIAISKKIPNVPLYLFGVSAVSKINEPIKNLVNAMLLTGASILCLGLGASYLLARRVTEPVLILTEAMNRYSTDAINAFRALNCLEPVLKRKDELGMLANTFREMGERIEKEVEDRLKVEHYFQNITDQTFDAITVIDNEGKILTWNHACEKIFGYTYAEVIGKNFHQTLIPDELLEQQAQGFSDFTENGTGPLIGKVVEVEAIHKNGHTIPVEVSVNVMRNHGRWNAFGIIRDLTEKKRLEEEKRAQEIAYIEQSQRALIQTEFIKDITQQKDEFESIFLHLNFGIAILDQNTRFIDCNGAFLNIVGLTREALMNKPWQELTYASDIPKVQSSLEAVIADEGIEELDQVCITYNDRTAYVNLTIALLPDKKRFLISAKDNTEKHLFEKKLQESENTFRGFMDSIGQMVAVMDEDGTYIDYFKGINASIHGYEKEQVLGHDLTLFTGEELANNHRMFAKIKQAYAGHENIHFEILIREKSGQECP